MEPPSEPGSLDLLEGHLADSEGISCSFVFLSGHSYLERLLNVEVPQKVR